MREALIFAVIFLFSPVPSTAQQQICEIEDAQIFWGFKESFRSYVSGSIANGSWDTSGDISYVTPTFQFSNGRGVIDENLLDGEVNFQGQINFFGHSGALNTSLGQPSLEIDGFGRATLFLDVQGATMSSVVVDISRVPFASVAWGPSNQILESNGKTWSVQNAEVNLVNIGAESFGTYRAGEQMDAISFSVRVGDGCQLQIPTQGSLFMGIAFAFLFAAIILTALNRPGRKLLGPKQP